MPLKIGFTFSILLLISSPLFAQKGAIINNYAWLFVNVENRMHVFLDGIPSNEIKILSSSGDVLTVNSSGNFALRPKSTNSITLKTYRYRGQDSTLIYKRRFSVKAMPKATASLGGYLKSKITTGEFFAKMGIVAEVLNYDYDLRVLVKGYTIMVLEEKELLYFEDCKGAMLSEHTKKELRKVLRPGGRVIITNIEIKPYYHFNKYVNSIELFIESE
jgi:hypothetical protein